MLASLARHLHREAETMTFFDQAGWDGRAYIGGWVTTGSTMDVVSPATGEKLATVAEGSGGRRRPGRHAGRGGAARLGGPLRRGAGGGPAQGRGGAGDAPGRAGRLAGQGGRVRPGQGGVELGLVAAELDLAAGMATMPTGSFSPRSPRLSLARRRPVGVVGVIAPFELSRHPRDAFGRARARPRQRGGAQARPAHLGGRRPVPRRRAGGGGRAGGRVRAWSRAGVRRARRWSSIRGSLSSRSRAPPRRAG